MLFDSVAPDVNIISLGSAPIQRIKKNIKLVIQVFDLFGHLKNSVHVKILWFLVKLSIGPNAYPKNYYSES